MRKWLVAGAALAALTGCGQQGERREERTTTTEELQTMDASEEAFTPPPPMSPTAPPPLTRTTADGGGPNISVTAAPGVAFNYRYAFRLANARIQAAQEQHAQMCERLTVARCRITGMRYSLVNERDITASLELKLDPAIARQFGKDATRVVTEAEGMLVDQQIQGVDMAPSIEGANRGRAALQDDLDRINRELARPGLSNAARERLLSEAAAARAQMRALGEQRQAAEDSLATTPMAFFYGSGQTVPGFDDDNPISAAFDRAGENIQHVVGFLIIAAATLLPLALVLALLLWLWRRFGVGAWLTRKSDESFARQQ